MTDIIKIQEEINKQLSEPKALNALISTTFKGLAVENIKKAIMEGMMRGFSFKDFLEKNVYAIPYGQAYSLVTSVDYARKVGMRSGVVGKSAPIFDEKNDKIISCTITIKRKVNEYIGEYSATAYMSEYSTGRNLWATKPRTMLAKVAEMHALRMACPEELAQSYIEEEQEQEIEKPKIQIEEHKTKLKAIQNIEELKTIWASLPAEAKKELEELKNELKAKYENKSV